MQQWGRDERSDSCDYFFSLTRTQGIFFFPKELFVKDFVLNVILVLIINSGYIQGEGFVVLGFNFM